MLQLQVPSEPLGATHEEEHGGAFGARAAAAEEPDHEDERPDGDEHVDGVLKVGLRVIEVDDFDVVAELVIDERPDADSQHGGTAQLQCEASCQVFYKTMGRLRELGEPLQSGV